jgi:hypothetical protein
MKRCAKGLAIALVMATIPAVAQRAQDPPVADSAAEARQQYQEGTKAFAAKKYAEAALHFESAASFKANAVALYTAGLAWDLAAKPERAADAYTRALDVSGLDAKQTATAKERVAVLERTLGTVSVSAPEGSKAQLDGFTEVPAPARLHASPGTHVLAVRLPSKNVERRDVAIEAGKVQYVDVKEEPKQAPKTEIVEPPREKPVAQPPVEPLPARLRETPFWTTAKVIGVGLAGVGLATLGAGAILGTSANEAKDAYDAAPSRPGFDHASSLETWTNVAFIAGGVLLASGIALVAIPLGERVQTRGAAVNVRAAPNGIIIGGKF